MKAKVTHLKVNLVGESVPPRWHGAAGRNVEDKLRNQGIPITKDAGPDIPSVNLEVKTRDLDATSAQSVGSMTLEDIINTPYRESVIFQKLQQQYRVKTKDQVIVSAEVYDFSSPTIQEKIEESYEAARAKIAAGETSDYISGGKFGYFERTVKDSRSYEFRFSNGSMKKIENMSTSNFDNIFTFE